MRRRLDSLAFQPSCCALAPMLSRAVTLPLPSCPTPSNPRAHARALHCRTRLGVHPDVDALICVPPTCLCHPPRKQILHLHRPLLLACRACYCCCNYRKWQRIEEEREARRAKQIAKSRRHFDPAQHNVPSYGTYETLDMEEGRGPDGSEARYVQSGVLERAVELHRSGGVGAGNIRSIPDF